jgi:bifunctional non-homologous end joining protein LigD
VVLDGEPVALDQHGVSRFQLLQNVLRHEAKLLYFTPPSTTCSTSNAI